MNEQQENTQRESDMDILVGLTYEKLIESYGAKAIVGMENVSTTVKDTIEGLVKGISPANVIIRLEREGYITRKRKEITIQP
tara:strand:- start:784 stop:1029 length:246 start_codon:yes stop_codon:yes gene_type:complete